MIIKLRARAEGAHVKEEVFVGEREGSLALAGELTMRPEEWQRFGVVLMLGARQMRTDVEIILEGEPEVRVKLGWD